MSNTVVGCDGCHFQRASARNCRIRLYKTAAECAVATVSWESTIGTEKRYVSARRVVELMEKLLEALGMGQIVIVDGEAFRVRHRDS